MKRLLLAALLALLAGVAHAQTGCTVQTQAQLLQALRDNAPPGSITPQVLRNVVCSVGVSGTLTNPTVTGGTFAHPSITAPAITGGGSWSGGTISSATITGPTISAPSVSGGTWSGGAFGGSFNGTVGATTPGTGAFTSIAATSGLAQSLARSWAGDWSSANTGMNLSQTFAGTPTGSGFPGDITGGSLPLNLIYGSSEQMVWTSGQVALLELSQKFGGGSATGSRTTLLINQEMRGAMANVTPNYVTLESFQSAWANVTGATAGTGNGRGNYYAEGFNYGRFAATNLYLHEWSYNEVDWGSASLMGSVDYVYGLKFVSFVPAGVTMTATGSGTNLTVTAPSGTILINATISGVGVPAGTHIVSQTSGTPGGAGVYVTSAVTTSVAATIFAEWHANTFETLLNFNGGPRDHVIWLGDPQGGGGPLGGFPGSSTASCTGRAASCDLFGVATGTTPVVFNLANLTVGSWVIKGASGYGIDGSYRLNADQARSVAANAFCICTSAGNPMLTANGSSGSPASYPTFTSGATAALDTGGTGATLQLGINAGSTAVTVGHTGINVALNGSITTGAVGGAIGFYGASVIAKATPVGACAGNTGCQALRDALGNLGLIVTGSITN